MEFKFRAGDLRPSPPPPPPPPPRSDSPGPPEFHYLSKQGFPDASLKLNTNIRTMGNSFDNNEAMHCEMELMRLREEKLLMEIERERFLKEEARKKLRLFEREMAIRGVAQSTGYSLLDQNRWAGLSSTTPSPSLAWGVAQLCTSAAQATSSSLSPAPRVVESTRYSFREHNQEGWSFSRSPFSAAPSLFSAVPPPFSAATHSTFSASPSLFSEKPFSSMPSLLSETPLVFSSKPSSLSAAPFKHELFNTTPFNTTLFPSPATTLSPSPTTTVSPSPATTMLPSPATTMSPSPATTMSPFLATTLMPSPATTSVMHSFNDWWKIEHLKSSNPISSMPSLLSETPLVFSSKPSSLSAAPFKHELFNTTPFNTTLFPSPATTLSPSPTTTVSPSPATTMSPSPATTMSPFPATTLMPSPATTSVMHSFNDWWKIEHLKSSNPIGFGVVSLPPRVQPLIANVKKEPQVLHAVKSELMETPNPEVFTENQKVKTPSVFTFGVKKNPKDKRSCADLRARNISQAASKQLSSKKGKLLKVTELAGSVGAKEKESEVGETLQCVRTEGSFIQHPIVPNFLKFAAKEDKQPNELGIELPHENPNPYIVREKQKVETLSASTFGIKPFGGKKDPKEEWSCDLCRLTMWTEMHYSEHLYGKRHRRKEADLRARMLSNVSRAATEPVPNKRRKLRKVTEAYGSAGAKEKESKVGETLQCEKTEGSFKLNATDSNFLKLAVKEDKQQNELVIEPLLGESSRNVFREKQKAEAPLVSVEIQPSGVKKNPKEWSCVRCQVTVPSEKIFNEHLHGKKHKRNLTMRLQEKPNPRENLKVKMPLASINNIQPFDVKEKNRWTCALCQVVPVANKKALDQHIRGWRHRRKEALLGARKESNVLEAATDPVTNERRNLLKVTEASGSAGTEKKEPKDVETVKCEKTEVIFIDLT